MLDRIEFVVRFVSKALAVGSAVAIATMALLIGYSTIMRYAAGSALAVTTELSSFLLVACVFLALPYAAVEGQHIKFTLLTRRLPPRAAALVNIATCLATLVFLYVLTKLTFEFTMTGYRLDSHSATARLYEVPWRAVMPVSSAWLAVVVAFYCVKDLTIAAAARRS